MTVDVIVEVDAHLLVLTALFFKGLRYYLFLSGSVLFYCCVGVYMLHWMLMEVSDNLQELVLFSHHAVPRTQTLLVRMSSPPLAAEFPGRPLFCFCFACSIYCYSCKSYFSSFEKNYDLHCCFYASKILDVVYCS